MSLHLGWNLTHPTRPNNTLARPVEMKPVILLIEGRADRSLHALALESQGWQVAGVADVQEALGWLASNPAHLVLVAGAAAVRGPMEALLQAVPGGVPLRVLAGAAEQEVLRGRGVPPEAFLGRSLSLSALVEGVRSALPDALRCESTRRPLLLVADDDPVGRKLLQLHVAPFRFDVVTACDGRAALELALRRRPDLVLADVLMPRLDGFRLCLALRQDPRLGRVPVILTHATAPDELDLRMAQNVGANGFVSRTQEGDEVVGSILRELRNGGPVPAEPPQELPTEEHLYRMVRQLERRVGLLTQAERAARESEERYRLVVEGSYDGVWDWDLRRQTLWWSPRLRELLGLSEGAWPGTHEAFVALLHPEDRDGVVSALSAHLERQEPYDVSFRLRHATGGYRHCVCRGRAIRDAQGMPVRMAGSIGDITEQLRLYHEAQGAVRARDEFLSVAAHELRTPLTTLRLRLQGLGKALRTSEEGLTPEKATRALEAADRQVQRLGYLVESLVDVSQLQGQVPPLQLEEADLAEVVREATDRAQEAAARAGCTLVLGALPPTPGCFDAARLSQVVTHLLANAVKFGPGRPVEVRLECRPDSAVLVVADQGIGIAPERVEGLFQRFERAVPLRHYGGLGLGLYRVRRIVEAHGGSIRADSRPGEGATFTVTLPRRATQPVAQPS
jgi:PAS domain S-box-containing protein